MLDIKHVVPDIEYVHPAVANEMPEIAERALDAGATPPLDYLGAGATAVVFCDKRGRGWKVARRVDSGVVADEAEWLRTAAKVAEVKKYVPRFYAWHAAQGTIERACVVADRENAWRWTRDLSDLHRRIEAEMVKHGWSAPEFKDDSYVITTNGPVLVDAGYANRLGHRLLRYVVDILEGRRPRRKYENNGTLAFYLRREVQEAALTQADVAPVLLRLAAAG
jgi:hypothetical protein